MKAVISNKKESLRIEQLWLSSFAEHLKDHKGKYLVGRYKWENFLFQPMGVKVGVKAQTIFNEKELEDYYFFNESLSECWEYKNEDYPSSVPSIDDWYLLPKSLSWTYIFTHDGQEIYLHNET